MENISLKNKTLKGVIWSGLEKFSTLFVQAICGLIIARFVSPHDYGIIGIITIFIVICNTLVDSGLSQVLIRKKIINDCVCSTVFYFNLVLGIIIYCFIFFLSPWLENFYKIDDLSIVARTAFIVVPLNSFALTQYALLQKSLDFRTISKISIISVSISACIGVISAYMLKNVWALVIQNISYTFLRVILLWGKNKWIPKYVFSFRELKEIFPLSLSLLSYSLISTITSNIYGLVIGKSFNAKELGFYSQADKLEKIPSESLTDVINKVTFPVLCKIQDDDKKMKTGYRKIIKITFYLLSPLMFFLSLESKHIFSIILPPIWQRTGEYFALLCWIGLMYPLHKINLNILIVKGEGKTNLILEIIRKCIMVLFLFITLPHGVFAVIIGHILYSFLALFLNMHYSGRLIGLSVKEQFKDIIPILGLSLPFVIIIKVVDYLIINHIVHVIIAFILCFAFYVSISYLLRINTLQEIVDLFKTQKLVWKKNRL